MKYLFYKINLSAFFILLCTCHLMATITIVSPTSSTSITACGNYVLHYNPGSGFSGNATAEVHQNNSSGATVKTYGYPSSYLSINYDNTVSASGLSPGNYQIKIYDAYNSSNYAWSDVFTISSLSAPATVNYSGYSTPTTFGINWSNSTGATEFRVDVSTDINFSSILPSYNDYHASGGDSGGFYVSGIDNSVAHYVRIRAYNSCSASGNSSTLYVPGYVCNALSTPTATAATSVAATSFIAHWGAVSEATNGYDLIVTRSGDAPVTYSTTGTSYTVNALHPSSNYSYYVVAKGCSNSSNSNLISLTTLVLGAPAITVSTGDGDEWGFNWASVPGATSYEWVASLNSNYSSPYLTGTETGTSADIWKTCNQTYWRVRARCQTGEYSAWTTQTIPENAGCAGRVASEENSESNVKETEVVFYPNPTDNFLRIELPKPLDKDKTAFKINDSKGREMKLPIAFFKNYVEVDVSEIPKGLYVVSVRDISFHKSFKFIRK